MMMVITIIIIISRLIARWQSVVKCETDNGRPDQQYL